jgi:ABC-type transporter Mla subunit MlaD
MFELLHHLLPAFDLLSTPEFETKELTVYFWLFMMAVVLIAFSFLIYHYFRARQRISAISSLISSQTRTDLAINRHETLEKALSLKTKEAGNLWREFDESLVFSSDQKFLFNTLDAEHFFNSQSLAHGLTSSRLLAATPSFLTAIGVLGTFIGLTLGLNQLQINSSDVSSLKEGVSMMINGASVAFMTSVWGVGLSLVVNFVEKLIERWVLGHVTNLQHKIDYLYPRIPAEQTLVHIADSSRESKEALQELHERIGDRLQETIEGISTSLQEAIAESLQKVVSPALKSISDNASEKSTEVLEKLIQDFMDGVNSAGKVQGDLLENAASSVTKAVSDLGQRMDTLFSKIEDQSAETQRATSQTSAEFAEKLQALSELADAREQKADDKYQTLLEQQSSLTEALISASSSIESSSSNLSESSRHIERLGSELNTASTTLTNRLNELMTSLEKVSSINSGFAEQLASHSDGLKSVQESLQNTSTQLARAAEMATDGFSKLGTHQEQFLQGISREFNQLSNSLSEQIKNVEKQAEEWLSSYSNEVSGQVSHRMEQWNKETLAFATQMRNTVVAISGLVEDLERKE